MEDTLHIWALFITSLLNLCLSFKHIYRYFNCIFFFSSVKIQIQNTQFFKIAVAPSDSMAAQRPPGLHSLSETGGGDVMSAWCHGRGRRRLRPYCIGASCDSTTSRVQSLEFLKDSRWRMEREMWAERSRDVLQTEPRPGRQLHFTPSHQNKTFSRWEELKANWLNKGQTFRAL